MSESDGVLTWAKPGYKAELVPYTIEFDEPSHTYKIDGVSVPSVTKVLDVLNKPAMPWWGMQQGVQGLLTLLDTEILDHNKRYSVDEVVPLLTEHKLTVNHVRDKAGSRGTAVHVWIEAIVNGNPLPELTPEEQKYVRSFTDWYEATVPDFITSEKVVGSKAHGYAGTLDSIISLDGEYWLIDFKTSKRVYDSQMIQVEAYERAYTEMGNEPTDKRGILHLQRDGKPAKLVESCATSYDFLPILETYRALEGIKAEKKRRKKGGK